jgi:nucleoside-triphosphatase
MPQHGRIILLSGASGSGKTTLCLKVIEKLKAKSFLVNGVVSPPEFDGRTKTGIALLDLLSGEKRVLAQLRTPESKGVQTHKWHFNEEVTRWGNEKLANSVPCDVLVIDELGPLEFERGLGFLNGFTAVESKMYQWAVVVIRPSLLEKAIFRWPSGQVVVVTPESRGALVDDLVNLLSK